MSFNPIPAIDIKGGKVVRLHQGDFNKESIYPLSPEHLTETFIAQGANRLHVVDLDGALSGRPTNMTVVERILKKCSIPVELGGGIRDMRTIESYLRLGVSYTILGTKACLDQGFLREALREFGHKIILGLDASQGFIATDAWTKTTKIVAADFAKQAVSFGLSTVIYTDIARDGALKGPNLEQISALCANVPELHVIASGGVSELRDIRNLISLKKDNLIGVIIGKAIYEQRLNYQEAVSLCSQKE